MKKLYSSIVLFFLTFGLWAQTPTYWNYNNIAGSNAFPWGSATKKIQWRINANSLGAVTAGNNITVIYFMNATAGTNTYPILNIGLKQGITQFAGGGNFETGFTNVFSGTNVTKTGTAGGWISFTLSTPFLYDPNQPLFIDVEQNSGSASGMGQCQTSPAGPGSGRQYGNYGSTAYTGVDATVAHFGIDVVPAVPCSTTPSTNSVVGPTAAICPNATANMNVTNTYSAASGGIVYQWQSSTTSSVGPFTSIPGATNSAYAAPNVTVNTWYNTLITCTAVTGTTTSSPYNVTVSPVITGSVPYYEGFEGIGVANALPNCSWAGSNIPVNCQTYIASNTLGRTPRTGSSFASFYYNPAGTRYFYTNGIQLNAGVTYSAGLWFQTEYYGYNNWTDLSILYGTTQTPTGLVSIASTNGPAISNVYKSLSNTFTVPTSGLYYFAIRGTGNTSSSAQYLSWDDFSVTIPCDQTSPNTPTLALSANSATVCAGTPVGLTVGGADTYTWSTGANGSSITDSPLNSTIYQVIGTNTLTGCADTSYQSISVTPAPVLYAISNKPSVCSGSPANITVFGASTYTWSNGSNAQVITVSPTVNTTYTALGSNAQGCTGMATQAINVLPLPNVSAVSSSPNEMCVKETATLTASGTSVNYMWTSSSSFLMSGASVVVSPNVTTTYTLTGTDANGCEKSTTIVQNVNECVGLNEILRAGNGVEVYPNPTSGEFTIELSNSSAKTIEVIDLTGRVVYSNTAASEKVKVNLSTLANGIYYVKIQTKTSTEVVKVVKQ